jgi:transcriptional regulator with XRE-family HTH domain
VVLHSIHLLSIIVKAKFKLILDMFATWVLQYFVTKNVLQYNILRRLRKSLGYTQAEFALFCGISTKSVYNAECGLYETPLESIADILYKNTDVTPTQLIAEYAKFRKMMRDKTRERYIPSMYKFSVSIPDTNKCIYRSERISPIADLYINALGLNFNSFSHEFLINPGSLYKLDRGDIRYVPDTIQTALLTCGCPNEIVRELSVRIDYYRPSRINSG